MVWQAAQEALAMTREEKLQRRRWWRQKCSEGRAAATVQAVRLAVQEELLQQMFGVKTLPQGVVLTSLPGVPQLHTCLCFC